MQDNFSDRVHPVLRYGLHLKSCIAAGEILDLDYVQAYLKDLLLTDEEAEADPGFGADPNRSLSSTAPTVYDAAGLPSGQRLSSPFLGARYALVCWLDEIFTDATSFGKSWAENKLESQLYRTNDRAWKFWEQARQAQSRPGSGALECFYLCVALGFRGELAEQPDKVRAWCNQTKLRLGTVVEPDFAHGGESPLANAAQPLHGKARFQRMALVSWVSLLVLIPVISYALTVRFGQ